MCVRDEAPAARRLQRHHRKAAQMCPFVRGERHAEERGFREEARQTFGTRKINRFVTKEQTSLARPHSPLTGPVARTACPVEVLVHISLTPGHFDVGPQPSYPPPRVGGGAHFRTVFSCVRTVSGTQALGSGFIY